MKKKLLAFVLCLVFVMLPMATIGAFAADPGYTLDEGTKTYTVTTADGLIAVASAINSGKLNYNVTLAADIDLKDKTWTSIGTSSGPYTGTFNGANFTIKNLKADVGSDAAYVSLIGKAGDGCTVKNLKMTDIDVRGNEFVAVIVGESAKGATTGCLTIENVHVRNAKIEAVRNKYAYGGVLIGKTTTSTTKIDSCSIVANVTSKGRASLVIGGEAVASDAEVRNIEISNTIVGGTCVSTSTEASVAGVFLGYHSTIPMTLTNCISFADLPNEGHADTAKGWLAGDHNKLSPVVSNCIFGGPLYGLVKDTTKGESSFADSFIYKEGATEKELGIFTKSTASEGAKVKLNGTDTLWADAKLPVINSKTELKTKAIAIFAGNTFITTAIIEELLGHEHSYVNKVAEKVFLKSEANCTDAAVYYQSCTCGAFDPNTTFTSGDPLGHAPSDKWTNDEENHWHICTACLEAKSDVAAHTFGEWEVTKEPTAKRQGERTKTCTVCGYEVTEKVEKLTASTTAAATKAEEQKNNNDTQASGGCGSAVLGVGTVMLVSLSVGAVCLKKKKD